MYFKFAKKCLLSVLSVALLLNQFNIIYASDALLNNNLSSIAKIIFDKTANSFEGEFNYTEFESFLKNSDPESSVEWLAVLATLYDQNEHLIGSSEEVSLNQINEIKKLHFPIKLDDEVNLNEITQVYGNIDIQYKLNNVSLDDQNMNEEESEQIYTLKISLTNEDIGYGFNRSNTKEALKIDTLNSNLYEAYSVNTSEGMMYYIKDVVTPKVVYCFNQSRTQPPLLSSGTFLPQYEKLDYLSSTDPETMSSGVKEQIAAVLYAGYPNDRLGLQAKYGLSDDKARYYTQDALWCLIRGDQWFGGSVYDYWSALMDYGLSNGSYSNGTVEFDGDFKLVKEGSVWKTSTISVKGTYQGIIEFDNLPTGMKVMNADTDNEINQGLTVGDQFYLVYSGSDNSQESFTITYNYQTTSVDFYKLVNGNGKDYQNLIGLDSNNMSQTIEVSIEKPTIDPSIPELSTPTQSVVINKVEEGTTTKLIGATLRLYEGTPENGKLIEEWITTDEVKKFDLEFGKTYTLVEVAAPQGYKIADPITFTVDGKSSNTDSVTIHPDDTDYVGYRYDSVRYITDGKTKAVVYCINHDLSNPEVVVNPTLPSLTDSNYPHYRHWALNQVTDDLLYENQTIQFNREQLAELMLAGYPNDQYNYQKKYNLTDSQAYSSTQSVLDAVLSGNTKLKNTNGLEGDYLALTNYYNDLITAYLTPQTKNATATIDFFGWVKGTGNTNKVYQNLVGVTPFESNITMEVTMEDAKEDSVIEPQTAEQSVEKIWDDANNQDGLRPESITVQLQANGKKVEDVTLNEANQWTHTWTNLPTHENGQVITYTVVELDVPTGYTSTSEVKDTMTTITNSHVPQTTEQSVQKIWDDANNQDGLRPKSITVQLQANGKKVEDVTLDESNHWTHTWINLPTYENGQVITYTVVELDVPTGYTSTSEVKGTMTTITNSHVPKTTEQSVEKIWDDANNQDGLRPESITVQLQANGKKVEDVTLNEANQWTHTWTNLPTYENGQVITYVVVELDVPIGYESTSDVKGTMTTITNSHVLQAPEEPETTPETPEAPEEPETTPETPETPEEPETTPETPEAPEEPETTPETPEAPEEPETTPETPEAPEESETTPEMPNSNNRPVTGISSNSIGLVGVSLICFGSLMLKKRKKTAN